MKAKARMKLVVRIGSLRFRAGVTAVSLVTWIAVGCFRTSTPKAENGFMAQDNCFVGLRGRNIGAKNPMNSAERLGANHGMARQDASRNAEFLNGFRRKKPLAN